MNKDQLSDKIYEVLHETCDDDSPDWSVVAVLIAVVAICAVKWLVTGT